MKCHACAHDGPLQRETRGDRLYFCDTACQDVHYELVAAGTKREREEEEGGGGDEVDFAQLLDRESLMLAMLHLEPEPLERMCKTNSAVRAICQSERFRTRYVRDNAVMMREWLTNKATKLRMLPFAHWIHDALRAGIVQHDSFEWDVWLALNIVEGRNSKAAWQIRGRRRDAFIPTTVASAIADSGNTQMLRTVMGHYTLVRLVPFRLDVVTEIMRSPISTAQRIDVLIAMSPLGMKDLRAAFMALAQYFDADVMEFVRRDRLAHQVMSNSTFNSAMSIAVPDFLRAIADEPMVTMFHPALVEHAKRNNAEAVAILLGSRYMHPGLVNNLALVEAVKKDALQVVELLLADVRVTVAIPDSWPPPAREKWKIPMLFAIERDNVAIFRLLYDRVVDLLTDKQRVELSWSVVDRPSSKIGAYLATRPNAPEWVRETYRADRYRRGFELYAESQGDPTIMDRYNALRKK